jgi:1,4-dihydroxy-2-naphthoate octaprenyltransferase
MALAYLAPLLLWCGGVRSAWVFLPFLTATRGWGLARTMSRCTDGPLFNATLRATAQLHGIFGLLLAFGLAVGG